MSKADDEWKSQLTDEEYHVCRKGGTEKAFSGKYWDCHEKGIYHCVCCGAKLFDGDAKFDSKTGWPSFICPIDDTAVAEFQEYSHNVHRVEIRCNHCDAHLGHVFDDGPKPTGMRYCINSVALKRNQGETHG